MNKNKRISGCLTELRASHPDWWGDIAKRHKCGLNDLEKMGYIEKVPGLGGGADSYSMTPAGRLFADSHHVYQRASLYEALHCRQGIVWHRGRRVLVYSDDSGQQFYFYYRGNCVGCGAYNPFYKEYVRSYIDRTLDFICDIDTSEFPGMKARLEYRKEKNKEKGKCLILSDRSHGMIDHPFYVGTKRTPNDQCIRSAKYIMSIIQLQQKREEDEKEQKEEIK